MDAESFKSTLKKLGLKQKYFARMVGYHEDSIGRFARGKLPVPKHFDWLLQEIEKNEKMVGLVQESGNPRTTLKNINIMNKSN
jgi:predicted transcriptional regulator